MYIRSFFFIQLLLKYFQLKKMLFQLFKRFKQRLNSQEVTVITKGDPELGVTVLLDGSNINAELKNEKKRLILSLGNPLRSK